MGSGYLKRLVFSWEGRSESGERGMLESKGVKTHYQTAGEV
jgi:hypothetical protein